MPQTPPTPSQPTEEYEEQLRAAHVAPLQPLATPIQVVDYDPAWPATYARLAAGIREALGARVVALHHAGSTSVPGLPAKPLIDIILVVARSADEARYVPDLEQRGYTLRIREPEWFEHRVLKHLAPEVNLHVFSEGCPEVERMLLFRDWLRTNDVDRDLYARAKRELAERPWKYMQQYADAKTAVVQEILARAAAHSPRQP